MFAELTRLSNKKTQRRQTILIHIITIAYNAEKTLQNSIDSILYQTHTNYCYYLIDNGSTDNTKKIIENNARLDDRIIPIFKQTNQSCVAINTLRSILETNNKNDYFCTLDADDEYKPDFLKKMLLFIQKNNLEIAACGSDFIDAQTKKICGARQVKQNLIIKGNGFNELFPVYHQFMRPIWAKVYQLSVFLKPNFTKFILPRYGGDTIFVMNAFHNADCVGILAESMHRYYISSKSSSYNLNADRISSDQILFDVPCEFLMSKCGVVTDANLSFLYRVYLNAIKDTIKVIINTNITLTIKMNKLCEIIQSEQTQKLISWSGAKTEKTDLFNQIAKWVLSQKEVRSNEGLDLAAAILAGIRLYPTQISGWDEKLLFILLIKIKDNLAKMNMSSDADTTILSITSKQPLLRDLNTGFLSFYREIIIDLLNNDDNKALNRIYDIISRGTDIPDEYFELFITLGMNLSAKMEQADSFVFFKKQKILLLIDQRQITDALNELADWDEILPDDVDFQSLRLRLTQ